MRSNRCETELSSGRLSYLKWGIGTPLLCLHGLGDQGLVWSSLGHELSHHYCCIAPDLPGHGNSFKPEAADQYLSNALVSVLEEFSNVNDWSAFHLIAHSWSAKLALLWARLSSDRIRSLILVDPFFVNRFPPILKPTLPVLYRVLPFLKMLGPFASVQAAEAVAKTLKQYQGWSQWQQELFQESIEPKPEGTWGSKFTVAARNGVFLDTFAQSGLTEPLETPTSIVLPHDGLNRSQWQLKPYKQYLDQPYFCNIPGNHWPHLVEPQTFNKTVSQILTSMESRT